MYIQLAFAALNPCTVLNHAFFQLVQKKNPLRLFSFPVRLLRCSLSCFPVLFSICKCRIDSAVFPKVQEFQDQDLILYSLLNYFNFSLSNNYLSFLSTITEILLIGGEYSQLTIVVVYYIPFKGLHNQLQCNTSRKIMSCCIFLLPLFSPPWLWFCILALNQKLWMWLRAFALSCHFCTMRMGAFSLFLRHSLFLYLLLDLSPGPHILLSNRRFPS